MNVTVTLSFDVNPEAWDLAYGTGTGAKAIREDVRNYVLTAVQGLAPVEEGGITGVYLVKR